MQLFCNLFGENVIILFISTILRHNFTKFMGYFILAPVLLADYKSAIVTCTAADYKSAETSGGFNPP